jgi:SAM-dependent methyltransferase
MAQTDDPSLLHRAYDATWGRLFAATYDRSLAKAEEHELGRRREAIVPRATGRVLELGAGTGLNLRRYGDGASELVLTEPFEPMARRLREKAGASGREVEVVETTAERLPFDDASFDAVVATLVLCTVGDVEETLAEVVRVLKPGGRLLFLEHVRAPEEGGLSRAQDFFRGPWFLLGHGCNCNRDTVGAIERSGLVLDDLERGELSGVPPIIRPVAQGSALKPA